MWNEPNKALWLNPASPETYVSRILNPGYRGIKSVNRRDLVAGGVTAPRGGRGGTSPADFIRRMDRARAQLDAYAHHPYPVYAGDTPFAGGCSCETITMAPLERLLRIVGQAFPSARIWLTEYAYQSRPDPYGVSLASSGALHRRGRPPRVCRAESRHARPLPLPRRARHRALAERPGDGLGASEAGARGDDAARWRRSRGAVPA